MAADTQILTYRLKVQESTGLRTDADGEADAEFEYYSEKTKPISKGPNEAKFNVSKGLRKKHRFRAPEKQSQFLRPACPADGDSVHYSG
jgi:hypothetical protein